MAILVKMFIIVFILQQETLPMQATKQLQTGIRNCKNEWPINVECINFKNINVLAEKIDELATKINDRIDELTENQITIMKIIR